ncbi:MAG: hypothetical protein JRI96_17725 [Deltaproteobacteria bacterium]|nr:hypothetical protein [Deltaproteobacteria bacterium]
MFAVRLTEQTPRYPKGRAGHHRILFLLFSLFLSMLYATCFFYLWPCFFIKDDGGHVLKYMDSFTKGYFYSYNPEDGPVYGTSGFIHGILSGFYAATGLVSPENSVLASNYFGLVLTSFLILLILRYYSSSWELLLPGWLLVLISSNFLVSYTFQGLETPLHLGIVLLCYFFYLRNNTKLMWLSCAISIISKLDAIPVATVLAFFYFVRLALNDPSWKKRLPCELKQMVLYCGIPLILWVIFTVIVFGSPLPQTAYAKMFFRTHPEDNLAFFKTWWRKDWLRSSLLLGISIAFCGYYSATRKFELVANILPFMCGSLAVFALYCVYNPNEQMRWYYVLPESLLVIQAVSIFIISSEVWFKRKRRLLRMLALVTLIILLYPSLYRTINIARGTIRALNRDEPERIAIGEWIRQQSKEGDRLYAGHGHIARYSSLYTYDYSGLNSKIITDLLKQGKNPLKVLQPEWAVKHGLLSPEMQDELGYRLMATYYNVSLTGRYPAWRIWKKQNKDEKIKIISYALSSSDIKTDGKSYLSSRGHFRIRGKRIVFQKPIPHSKLAAVIFGVKRVKHPLRLSISLVSPHSEPRFLETISIAKRNPTDYVNGLTQRCIIWVPGDLSDCQIELKLLGIESTKQEASLVILDPALVVEIEKGKSASNLPSQN